MAFIDVINYEGNNDVIVFKHPIENFNRKARLIVHEKQEAVVFRDGEAQEVFEKGKYLLESKNLPGIKHVAALFSGGMMENHYEIYFINKVPQMNIPWVTTPMDIQDTTLQVNYAYQAQGYFKVSVTNAFKLLEVVGTAKTFSTEDLKEYFQEIIISSVKEVLSQKMVNERLSYGEINSHYSDIAKVVTGMISQDFAVIGLSLDKFIFNAINLDKDAIYEAQNWQLLERSGQRIEGRSYAEKRGYDVLEKQAENQGSAGTAASIATGAVYGVGAGQVIGGMMGNMANNMMQNSFRKMNESSENPEFGIVHPKPLEIQKGIGLMCPKCKKNIQEDWLCCPFCGERLKSERKCKFCGKPLPEGAWLCPYCRNSIT